LKDLLVAVAYACAKLNEDARKYLIDVGMDWSASVPLAILS